MNLGQSSDSSQSIKMKTHYVLYARKSSESEDKQMASISSQIDVLKELAIGKNIKIFKRFTESKSAKAPGRSEFNTMLEFIESRNDIKGIICWKLNRLTRNPIDTGKLQWLLQTGVFEEIVTPSKTYTEIDSDFIMAVEGAQANRFIRDLREDTKRGLDAKISKGIAPVLAPPGYKNDTYKRQGEKTISPHPTFFTLMRKVFDLALTGTFSMGDLYKKAIEMGIKSARGKDISKSQFLHLLRNPFYTGKFIYGEQLYQGIHKPMLSEGEFNHLQSIISGKSRPRKQIHDFPLTGLIRCKCGYMITGETHKKKSGLVYNYYKCSKKGKGCLYPMISAPELERQVYEFLDKIHLSDKFVGWAIKWLKEAEEQDRDVRHDSYKTLKEQHNQITNKLDALYDAWLTSRGKDDYLLTDEEYRAQKQRLLAERSSIYSRLHSVDRDWETWTELSIQTFKLANEAQENWLHGSIQDKKTIMTVVGSNLILHDRKLTIEPKTPFLLIQKALRIGSNSYDEAKLGSSEFLNTVLGG